MAAKKKVKRKVGRPKKGAGLWDDIKKTVSKAHDWIKSNKVVSRVAGALSAAGVPYAGTIAKVSGTLGYGMKKGGALNLKSIVSSAHKFVKDKKLISSALKHFGHNKLSAVANSLGYGKPKTKAKKKKVGGALNLRSIVSGAHKFIKDKKLISGALKHFGHNKLSSVASSLGYGKPRKIGGSKVVTQNRYTQVAKISF